MTDIRVTTNGREVAKALRLIPRKVVDQAAAAALNRTLKNVQRFALKQAAKDMGVTTTRLSKGRSVGSGSVGAVYGDKASRAKLQATLTGLGRPFNLIRFGGRQTKKGVSHKAWGRRQVAKGAFIGNSGRTAFIRRRNGKIRGAWGPGLAKTIADKTGPIEDHAAERFRRVHFPSRLRQALRRSGFNVG